MGGGYWIYAQAGLFLVSDLSKKKSYTDYTIAAVAQDQEWTTWAWAGTQQFKQTNPAYSQGAVGADFIIMEQDDQTLLVSIVESADNSVSVVDITNAPDSVVLVAGPNGNTFFKSEGLPEPFPGNTTNTWGSAWKTSDDAESGAKILFSRDYGGELYEMQGLDTVTKMAKFKKFQ